MAKLTAAQRRKIPSKDFALPGGRYPINDKNHAKAALSRAAHNASPEQEAEIRRKVHQKYPSMGVKRLNEGNPPKHKPKKGRKAAARKRVA